MYPAGNLFIRAPHGRLEAILKEPKGKARGVALVLHPHPLGGGTMHNKVVFSAAAALSDAGLITLRINFRGVGQSTSTHDEGRGEQDDAHRALDYLAEQYPQKPITLAGFSFGALVGMQVGIRDPRVTNLISIGTPVGKYDFGFLKECRKPILFVHGEHDEFGDAGHLRVLVDELKEQIGEASAVQLEVIPGAGHFFDDSLDELKRVIGEWIERQLKAT
jgi:alpha/beta superfamily hydrolase